MLLFSYLICDGDASRTRYVFFFQLFTSLNKYHSRNIIFDPKWKLVGGMVSPSSFSPIKNIMCLLHQ